MTIAVNPPKNPCKEHVGAHAVTAAWERRAIERRNATYCYDALLRNADNPPSHPCPHTGWEVNVEGNFGVQLAFSSTHKNEYPRDPPENKKTTIMTTPSQPRYHSRDTHPTIRKKRDDGFGVTGFVETRTEKISVRIPCRLVGSSLFRRVSIIWTDRVHPQQTVQGQRAHAPHQHPTALSKNHAASNRIQEDSRWPPSQ